jgi:hypothetical protein
MLLCGAAIQAAARFRAPLGCSVTPVSDRSPTGPADRRSAPEHGLKAACASLVLTRTVVPQARFSAPTLGTCIPALYPGGVMRHSFALAAALATVLHAAPGPRVLEHLVVYEQPGRFGGWPANNGLWAWGNEILVGLTAAHYLKQDIDKHQIDRSKPGVAAFGRSRDGGKTWSLEQPAEFHAGAAATSDLREPLDFSSPGFAMTIRSGRPNSLLYHSSDRGHTWKGPYRFPLFGQPGIDARTDYLVNGRRDCLAFLTASKANGKEGRVICVRTRDGGLT